MADAWTLFGTTVTLKRFFGFMKIEEHQGIINKIGWFVIVRTFIHSIPLIVRIISRSLRMKKAWPWDDYSNYLDITLHDIRDEFGIYPLIVR